VPRKTKKKKPVDLSFAFELPPEAAMKYFRSKGYVLTGDWHEMLGEAHAKAFTVAQVAKMDILQDLRGAVDQAIADGQTFREFRKNLEPTLKKKGWWGKGKVIDKKTGKLKTVQLGSPRRLRTIYRTNMKMAYAAGREEQFQRNKKYRPYGQFVAIIDPKTRDEHRRLHKKTFPLDDPFWASFTPPLDFECRCRKRTLSEAAVKRRGIKVLSSKGKMVREDQLISKRTGELRKVTGYKLPGGGKVFPRVGFDHNPWKAAWQPNLDKYDYDIARHYIVGTVTGPDFKRFVEGKKGGKFPVAVMDPKTQKMMGSKSQVLHLSDETMKHIEKHGIGFDRLQDVQKIVDDGIMLRPNKVTKKEFQFIGKSGGKPYVLPVKVTENSREVYVSTFFRINENRSRSKIRKGRVLRKEK